MKKILCSILILHFFIITGCEKNNDIGTVNEDFNLYSLVWGASWEESKNNSQIDDARIVVDDEYRLAVEIEKTEFLGIKGKMILHFSRGEKSYPYIGFTSAIFSYNEEDEKKLLEGVEKKYGERKECFLDEKGMEYPLNPPAWYCEETVEKSLTQAEKNRFLKLARENNVEDVRADAHLRGPLVVMRVFENENYIEINGRNAAKVKNLKE